MFAFLRIGYYRLMSSLCCKLVFSTFDYESKGISNVVVWTNLAVNVKLRNLFCSTSLPLASTRWVQSTIKHFFHALCTHTKQCTAVDKSLRHQEIWISPKKSWKRRELNPGRLSEKCKSYLCAMLTLNSNNL